MVTLEASGLPLRSVVIDIDNDGFNDVLGMGDEGGTVFLNDGFGVLDPRTLVDCVCGMTSVQVKLYSHECDPSTGTITATTTGTFAAGVRSSYLTHAAAGDVDGDGDIDVSQQPMMHASLVRESFVYAFTPAVATVGGAG